MYRIILKCGAAALLLLCLFVVYAFYDALREQPEPQAVQAPPVLKPKSAEGPPYHVDATFSVRLGDSSKKVYQRPVSTQTNNNTL